ncbi:MAG TPA: alanine--tRNA ligase-related protein [Candidatus Dojkabacteria bacterium]|nr:alanine--tRNA ligase-related protein [Candidatus Dojkabacteria bacterium]
MPTTLLYMWDTTTSFTGSKVLEKFSSEDSRTVLILDKTIFYPQGGGQQYDQGTIENQNGKFDVQEVRFVEGRVFHIGSFINGNIDINEEVSLNVNPQRRELNSKLQSAGHLIDMALRNIGKTDITPLKGYHFPDGPYVEYIGEISGDNLVTEVQKEIDRMTQTGYEVIVKESNIEEAKQLCYFFPQHIPEGKPIRIVSVWDNQYIPCGGTHVKNVSDLKGLHIREIKSKKGNTRVSYKVGA